ncbi:hypothetical protein FGO68_gene4161 [Halteria grandinella]|uniref:Uncharacterized protein n=1 Tax=Halteria grandinella TaxID=5974 RepID=A0A8J8T5P2_HALGN|nr:hypothetical protein FGO68_gene4161 [Halteria grandinella]
MKSKIYKEAEHYVHSGLALAAEPPFFPAEILYSPAATIFTDWTGFSLTISSFCMILNALMPLMTLPNTTYLVSKKLRGALVVTQNWHSLEWAQLLRLHMPTRPTSVCLMWKLSSANSPSKSDAPPFWTPFLWMSPPCTYMPLTTLWNSVPTQLTFSPLALLCSPMHSFIKLLHVLGAHSANSSITTFCTAPLMLTSRQAQLRPGVFSIICFWASVARFLQIRFAESEQRNSLRAHSRKVSPSPMQILSLQKTMGLLDLWLKKGPFFSICSLWRYSSHWVSKNWLTVSFTSLGCSLSMCCSEARHLWKIGSLILPASTKSQWEVASILILFLNQLSNLNYELLTITYPLKAQQVVSHSRTPAVSRQEAIPQKLYFDEQRFDLDEYEQRLQRFEDYLKRREDESTFKIQLDLNSSTSSAQEKVPERPLPYPPQQNNVHQEISDDQLSLGVSQPQIRSHKEKSEGSSQQRLNEQLTEVFKTYCDKFRPLDGQGYSKVHLRKIRDIAAKKWQAPMYKANFMIFGGVPNTASGNEPALGNQSPIPQQVNTQEKVGSLVTLAKSINYLQKKKQEFEQRQSKIEADLEKFNAELLTLQEEIETYEYQSYQEIIEEIQSIKQSNEYVQEAGKDPYHYLRLQITEMESRAPKLKRYEKLQEITKRLEDEQGENAKFYKATCEDLVRMKMREKHMLNQSIDSFGLVTPGAKEQDYSYQESEGFEFEKFVFNKDER